MESSAISSILQAAPLVAGARVPTPTPRQSGENIPQPSNTPADHGTEAAKQAAQQRKAAEKEAASTNASETPSSVGRIRFELDDGTRVAKFFDTKDVLIYQVPPEGNLYLVRVQETDGQDQIETSA